MKSLIIAAITIPLDAFVRALVVCGWVQGMPIQKCCEGCGAIIMKGVLVFAVFFLIIGFIIAGNTNQMGVVVTTFAMAQIEGWAFKFVSAFALFSIFFNCSKASFRKKYPGLVSIEISGLSRPSQTDAGVLMNIQSMKEDAKNKAKEGMKGAMEMLKGGGGGANVQQGEEREGSEVSTQKVGGVTLLSLNNI